MTPKPFPYPYRVGVDICSIARIQSLVDRYRSDNLVTWGSKVFHRLEWPHFLSKTNEYSQNIGPEASKVFVQWLAGRWAAKEAAIKAHSQRKLHMRDVILLPTSDLSNQSASIIGKPSALVDPPRRTVLMNEEVARQRGLRQKQNSNSFSNSEAGMTPEAASWARWDDYSRPVKHLPEQPIPARKGEVRTRKLLVTEKERQTVDISISHDGDYAIAICLAVDDVQEQDLEPITDKGIGDAIHEPEWRDRGFLIATTAKSID